MQLLWLLIVDHRHVTETVLSHDLFTPIKRSCSYTFELFVAVCVCRRRTGSKSRCFELRKQWRWVKVLKFGCISTTISNSLNNTGFRADSIAKDITTARLLHKQCCVRVQWRSGVSVLPQVTLVSLIESMWRNSVTFSVMESVVVCMHTGNMHLVLFQ